VINIEPENERGIARNAERVVSAWLRDARFFWEADRKTTLESRMDRLGTLLFHKKLGSYRDKAERIEKLALAIAAEHLGASPEMAAQAAQAARLAKVDLTTDMVREFTELQGTMGGIYARGEGLPEEVWKAIYFHYLPVGVDADAAPSRAQVKKAATTWAAVSLADKLDTLTGLFAAGEKPTGSRDPYGLRRAAQGVVKILTDLPALGIANASRVDAQALLAAAAAAHANVPMDTVRDFLWERAAHLFEKRGYRADEIRVVAALETGQRHLPLALERLAAVSAMRGETAFGALANLFKRVKNITKGIDDDASPLAEIKAQLREPAEQDLADRLAATLPRLDAALADGKTEDALQHLAALHPVVDRFFTDVLVMADDPALRKARLALVTRLRSVVLTRIGDISELAVEEK
jgi:glycyl-tRNA synthetase beta chain